MLEDGSRGARRALATSALDQSKYLPGSSRRPAGLIAPGRAHGPGPPDCSYGRLTLVLSPLLLSVKVPEAVEL